MSDLDLDISNYETKDLEAFFRLKVPYNEHDVMQKEAEIRELLLSTGHIEKQFKRDLIIFLDEGKRRLISASIRPKPHTTIHTTEPGVPHHFPEKPAVIPTRQENVIPPKETQYIYNKPSEYFPGVLNPLDTRTIQKFLSVDSRCRPNQTSHSDFTVSLPNRISKVLSMECTSVEIPYHCLYNISSQLGNNYLYISITTVEQDYNGVFTIPDGHYDMDLLLFTLNRLFSDQAETPFLLLEWKKDPYGSNKCILMMNEDPELLYFTQKCKCVSINNCIDINGKEDTEDICTKLPYLLGFTKPFYQGCTNYCGEIPVNTFASLPYFYLSVDDFQNRSVAPFEPAHVQVTMSPSILARISILNEKNTLELVKSPRQYFGPVDITRLQVRLLDPYGRPLTLDGNMSFCLALNVVYDL